MSDRILSEEGRMGAEDSTGVSVKTEDGSAACSMQGKGWVKGPLGMAICCATPLLVVVAISFFGLSLGAIANGALSLAAILACPVGMYFIMRMMNKKERG